MSVQDDIAAALAQIAAAKDALNNVANAATGAINRVSDAYTNRINTLYQGFTVDQITGSDTNAGFADSPVKSLQVAINKVPIGGIAVISLASDYVTSERIFIRNKFVIIQSSGGVQRRLSFGQNGDVSQTPAGRNLFGFRLQGNASIVLQGLTVAIPQLGGFGSFFAYGEECLFSPTSGADTGAQHITINACNLDIPASPFGALLNTGWVVGLQLSFCTLIGQVTSLNGRVVKLIDNVSGTATTTLPFLRTNLTTI